MRIASAALSICLVAAALQAQPSLVPPGDAVADALRARLENAAEQPSALIAGNQPLYSPAALLRFYQPRVYRPAWLVRDRDGSFGRVRELLRAIEGADRHGLEPFDYHLRTLRALLWRFASFGGIDAAGGGLLVDLELAATDAFLVYASHLVDGRVDPVSLKADWTASPGEADPALVLEEALAHGGIGDGLGDLLPRPQGYRSLQEALQRYRSLAAGGGWPALPSGPKLEVGTTGRRVTSLRQRLAIAGELDGNVTSDIFDETLANAVRAFQERHGLEVDGVVGPSTEAALAVPASERALQIALNLERWRWLPRDLGSRYILVNVAAFELRAIEDGETAMAMRAVVGRPYRSTPTFSATMTYLVVSPYWHIPPSIAKQDILPAVAKDPFYLSERGIKVFEGWGAQEKEIDPASVDWKSFSKRPFPYRFRQEPGDQNSLGRLKLMFPNAHSVYLHDTPARELFLRARRDWSSGCIRIERPFDLAVLVLRGDSQWTRDALTAASTIDAETTIPLREPIPVHVQYWTSWSDDAVVQFRDDIYDRDPGLAAALATPPPGPL